MLFYRREGDSFSPITNVRIHEYAQNIVIFTPKIEHIYRNYALTRVL